MGEEFLRHGEVLRRHYTARHARKALDQLRLELEDFAADTHGKRERRDALIEAAMSELEAEVIETFGDKSRKVERRVSLEIPPGLRLDRLAQLLPKRTYECVLKPCLAEMQQEYFEALQAGDEHAAKRARFWGIATFWWTVFAQIPESVTGVFWRPRT
jgi:hypothetical protein